MAFLSVPAVIAFICGAGPAEIHIIQMLSPTNFWMGLSGVVYLAAGVFIARREFLSARGLEKLVSLACIFIAVSLAVFAPEHFRGPEFVQSMVPSWMPAHLFWAYFVGCALLAAATSLTLRMRVGLSSMLLGLMFVLFVCMLYLPSALRHPRDRFAWAYALRDLSFGAGAWALAGLHRRTSSPRLSAWMISFGRAVFAVAALYYASQHFIHPDFAPGVPLEEKMPGWVPFPTVWGYLAGVVLLASGLGLALNMRPRLAAASIGALMAVLTIFPYLAILFAARAGSATEINDALNYAADTLLYAGSALALASALPRCPAAGEPT
jgi:uncharacterized membrane protein